MKHAYKHTKPQPSWLLQGLMIRAGLYDPLPPVTQEYRHSPYIGRSGLRALLAKVKAAFGYGPARS